MRYYFIVFAIAFFASILNGQTIKADYELVRNKGGRVFNADGSLYSNGNETIFKLKQYKNLLTVGDKFASKDPNQVDSTEVIGAGRRCTDDKEYFYNRALNQEAVLIYDGSCKSKTLIRSDFIVPEWEIMEGTFEVNGYSCQKAKAQINDREWVAYFTQDLKRGNVAPWRLNGLPGVVVQAADLKGMYEFTLIAISIVDKLDIVPPAHNKIGTLESFKKKAIKKFKDEMYFAISNLEGADLGTLEREHIHFPKVETLDFVED